MTLTVYSIFDFSLAILKKLEFDVGLRTGIRYRRKPSKTHINTEIDIQTLEKFKPNV